MRHPRTPQHFPHMKIRGARRRAQAVLDRARRDWSAAGAADTATKAFAAMGVSAEQATTVLYRFGQAVAELGRLPDRDPYLEALGRDEPPASEACPSWFQWSAFGGSYPDTSCYQGRLVDVDSTRDPEQDCPMCNPAGFYEQNYGGGYIVPTCARCERMLPDRTPLQFHELGRSIVYSAECPTCEKRTWTVMRDYGPTLGDNTPEWHPAEPETAGAVL